MSNSNNLLNSHLDHDRFLASIEYTSAETGFDPRLIEKDYFCSLILNYLYSMDDNPLVFKGGTLLAKVHAGFYRLSEDLDFAVPMTSTSTRKQRSSLMKAIKPRINSIDKTIPELNIEVELKGSNQSKQYNAKLQYPSCLSGEKGRILIEISLRSELLLPVVSKNAKTVILNPFTKGPDIQEYPLTCLDKKEAYAEKVSAALNATRLAIRDYFDIDYAIKNKHINFTDTEFINYIQTKVAKDENDLIQFDDTTVRRLENKIVKELEPTLRKKDIGQFNLHEVIEKLNYFAHQHL